MSSIPNPMSRVLPTLSPYQVEPMPVIYTRQLS